MKQNGRDAGTPGPDTPGAPRSGNSGHLLSVRRAEHRFVANQPVRVAALHPPFDRFPGALRDVSRNGIGVEVPTLLYLGTRVMVSWEGIRVFGEVRHCRQESERTFFVGIRIENAY